MRERPLLSLCKEEVAIVITASFRHCVAVLDKSWQKARLRVRNRQPENKSVECSQRIRQSNRTKSFFLQSRAYSKYTVASRSKEPLRTEVEDCPNRLARTRLVSAVYPQKGLWLVVSSPTAASCKTPPTLVVPCSRSSLLSSLAFCTSWRSLDPH